MKKFARFDAHVKAKDGVQTRTLGGAIVSIAAVVTISLLFVSEWNVYRKLEVRNHMKIDAGQSSTTIPINLKVTFPQLPCKDVNLDADGQRNKAGDVKKNVVKTPYLAPYLKDADTAGTWDGGVTESNAPGCTIDGSVTVTKVAGNVHVALGAHTGMGGNMLYQFSFSDLNTFNASHYIHKLSFGAEFPGQTNPLDNVHNEVQRGTGQYMYYIKVVPSKYTDIFGKVTYSNEYSVTEHFIGVNFMTGQFPHPGLFFKYDFSPIMVEYQESRLSFFHFLTNVCAILGGVFTVFSLFDGFVYTSQQAILGKQD
jgi:hypothetical protein